VKLWLDERFLAAPSLGIERAHCALRTDRDQSDWLRWLARLHALRHSQTVWLPRDIISELGLVLTSVLVPVRIAYSVASGLPGICGLYATIAG